MKPDLGRCRLVRAASMEQRAPTRDDFRVEGDKVIHAPTGKCYQADPESAESVNENSISAQGYREADLREMAKQIVSERVRIAQRLRRAGKGGVDASAARPPASTKFALEQQ